MLAVASAVYAVGLWSMTLRPVPYDENVEGFVDILVAWFARQPITAWLTIEVVEFLANIALFVPFGLLAVWWGARWGAAIALGLAASGLIELLQLLFLPERVADVRDLVSNTLGAALGAAAVVTARRCGRARRRSPDPTAA